MGPKPPAAFLARPTAIRFGVLGFACALALLTYLDRVCMMRVKESIQVDLHLSDVEIGWVLSIFLVGYGLFEVPAGWMGDTWGPRRVLAQIVVLWSIFTALTGCVWYFSWNPGPWLPFAFNSFILLVLMRFCFGLGEAGAFPNLTRVVRNWFPFHERAFAAGAIWMSARLGGALAPAVIGGLTRFCGWRLAFVALGSLGLVWSALFFWWFRNRPEETDSCNKAERELIRTGNPQVSKPLVTKFDSDVAGARFEKATAEERIERAADSGITSTPPRFETPSRNLQVSSSQAHGHSLPPLRNLVGSGTIWAICLISACVSFGWYFLPTWQAQYYKDVHGLSYQDSEIVTGLPFLFGAVGCLFGGRLSDRLVLWTGSARWGRSLLGVVGFTLAGLCIASMGFAARSWQAIALLCLANLVNDMAIPVIWAVCADIGGRYTGSVAGLMNSAGAIGGMLSPLLIPVVLQLLPPGRWQPVERWQIIFIGLAGAWFVGAVAWLFVDASKPLFAEKQAN